MAEIVAAVAMTHAPGLTGWFDRGSDEDRAIVVRAVAELRRRLDAAGPDVLLMLSNDHLLNWPINNTPSYTVGVGEEHVFPSEWFDEWLALPRRTVRGHPDLARSLVSEGAARGVMFAHLRRMEFDDGLSVPLHLLTPQLQYPIVPITLNFTVPPVPDAAAFYRFGSTLREIVESWPGPERVAVVATGGLSHEPGGPRYLSVDEAFDRWFLDLLAKGDHAQIVEECTWERLEAAGSGGTAELYAWICTLPFTSGPAEVLGYTPGRAWRCGTGMVAWPVS